MVPEEVWTKRKPHVKHLKVFGSLCFRHIPYKKRKKLDDKNESMILVGYHSVGSYRLYNHVNQKIIISKDVFVDEKRNCDWKA